MDEAQVDKLVRDILRIVLSAQNSDQYAVNENAFEENHALARRVASESITLLKNDIDLLPLSPDKVTKIAVIG